MELCGSCQRVVNSTQLIASVHIIFSLLCGKRKRQNSRVKYWEIIADNLSKAGWSWGCVSGMDSRGQTIFVVDAHRDDGKRFVLRADEKLTAFVELEAAIRGCGDCKPGPRTVLNNQ
jgi:hypothetical protein